jgi:hypothetical protein
MRRAWVCRNGWHEAVSRKGRERKTGLEQCFAEFAILISGIVSREPFVDSGFASTNPENPERRPRNYD